MKAKRIIALFLLLAMMASMFVGCNGNNTDQPTDKETQSEAGTTEENEETTEPETEYVDEIGPSATPSDNPYGLTEETADGTILHCFAWSFKTIEESLEDIAMAGFSTIQTSPINACSDGGTAGLDLYGNGKWYYHYQPTDWTIGNYQLGTKDEFISMCTKAEEMGIKVIVDVAPNHTTKDTEDISQDLIDAVGGLDKLYHKDGMKEIIDYTDKIQRTLWAVGGLYDVNTELPEFQNYFIKFLNDCIACGADGFRYDTAKHIGLPDDPQDDPNLPNNFWERVMTEINNRDELFIYGEVLQDGGERIEEYISVIGAATASTYGDRIRNAIDSGLLYSETMKNLEVDNTTSVVTWVESHDNYTGDNKTGRSIDNNELKMAYTILIARGEGTPLFFSRPYGATSSSIWGTFNRIGMAGDNLYKDPMIVAANRFRNAMVGLDENFINPDDNRRVLAIERGTKGLYLQNNQGEDFTFNMETRLEDGTYVNRYDETETFVVEKGVLTGTLKAKSVAFLYNEGYLELADPAVVKVADDTEGLFLGDSLDVTLVAENAAKSTYSINGGEEVAFANGDVITIGEGLGSDEAVILTLRGENAEGNKTCITYAFRKQQPVSEGTTIYFVKPEGWGDKIYAYVYDETSYSSVKANKSWPGVQMELEEDGTYSYTFTEDWIAPLVIFGDGTNQSNGAMEPGAGVEANKVYTLDDF